MSRTRITPVQQDYLDFMHQKNAVVSLTDCAEKFETALSNAGAVLNSLINKGLVKKVARGRYELTNIEKAAGVATSGGFDRDEPAPLDLGDYPDEGGEDVDLSDSDEEKPRVLEDPVDIEEAVSKLSSSELAFYEHLRDNGHDNVTDMGSFMGVHRNTAIYNMEQLEQKGLVVKVGNSYCAAGSPMANAVITTQEKREQAKLSENSAPPINPPSLNPKARGNAIREGEEEKRVEFLEHIRRHMFWLIDPQARIAGAEITLRQGNIEVVIRRLPS